ncbi:MAG: hypothetical protein EOO40_00675 [Deltaproteobacteria bacterium]|nr:MAG: hypothetical protein EOO40_00675 [Deltaproteobacteria bacterium]
MMSLGAGGRPQKKDFYSIDHLPADDLANILRQLDPESLACARGACRDWRHIASRHEVVAGALRRDTAHLAPRVPNKSKGLDYGPRLLEHLREKQNLARCRCKPIDLPVSAVSTVEQLTFSPDNRLLAIAEAHLITLWDLSQSCPVARLPLDCVGSYETFAFSPDSRQLTTSHGGNMDFWDLTQAPISLSFRTALPSFIVANNRHPLPYHSPLYDMAYSPDGELIAIGGDGGGPYLAQPAKEMQFSRLYADADYVNTVAFAPNGQWLVAGGRALRLWDRRVSLPQSIDLLGALPFSQNVAQQGCSCVQFSPDSRALVTVLYGEGCVVWDLTHANPFAGRHLQMMVHRAFFRFDAYHLVTDNLSGQPGSEVITRWDLTQTPAMGQPIMLAPMGLSDYTCSSDGLQIVISTRPGSVALWDFSADYSAWQALLQIDGLLAKQPNDANLRTCRGAMLAEQGQFCAALDDYNWVVDHCFDAVLLLGAEQARDRLVALEQTKGERTLEEVTDTAYSLCPPGMSRRGSKQGCTSHTRWVS